jgi:diacylglycerol kinase
MNSNKFSISKRMKSFGHAFNGLKVLVREEPNARIHLFAAAIAIGLGWFFNVSGIEWIAILFAIGFVIVTEILNTSIENIADFISPEKHVAIKKIKDLAAGAVLISAIVALIIGLTVFIPYVSKFLDF